MIKTSILSSAKSSFELFVAKKNKKAAKLGCPEIQYTFGNTFFEKGDAEGNKYEFIEVLIDESLIKLNGWNIIGRIEENDGNNIVTGYGDLSSYRDANINFCDHCCTHRARKAVFIVSNGTETKVVGSTCLNDFIGHTSALQYAANVSWVEIIEEIIDEQGWNTGSSRDIGYSIKHVLEVAASAIRQFGYTSKAKAEELGICSTIDDVKYVLFSKNEKIEISEEDKNQVESALEWFENTQHENSDYFYNLSKLIDSDYVKSRFIGILVSLLPTYHRAIAVKADFKESKHIGNVGDKKVMFSGKCIKALTFQSNFGMNTLYLIVTSECNMIKYCTTTNFTEEGEELTFTATIKAHDVYNGVNQTVITRAKKV